MTSTHRFSAAALASILLAATSGCDDGKATGESKPAEGADDRTNSDDKAVAKAAEKAAKTEVADAVEDDAEKDKGSGSMKVGDTPWQAERCRARLKDKTLNISCSHTDMSDGKVTRQEVKLVVGDYDGPGKYKASSRGSMFIGVGMDIEEIKAAEKDDTKTSKVATDAIKGGTTLMLIGADVEVTAAGDGFFDGTFAWSGGPSSKKPPLSDGKFHAVVRKKKPK